MSIAKKYAAFFTCVQAFIVILLSSTLAFAEITIILKNDFIEKYKNRATIDANYIVDMAHKQPNPPSKDGDIHIAGRSDDIQLPVVAEIMNAASRIDAIEKVHAVEGKGNAVEVSGAWRIWCEHGGNSVQQQGQKLEQFQTTNPDHVFQIHPVSSFAGIDVTDTFRPINGFKTKDAHEAFVKYEGITSKISVNNKNKTTSIQTTMAGYNYVEFIMELSGDQKEVTDGRFVFASVRDLEGELLVRNRRMVFVRGTEPEKIVKTLKKGDRLHVLGIPRIDLALLSWRAKNYKKRPEVLTWNLPYEIIVVAAYKD